MARGVYTEGDFDRLMVLPFCMGVVLIGIGLWYPSKKLALLGVALAVIGAALIWLMKPKIDEP